MTTTAYRRYISPAEAAKELGLSTSSVYRAISKGNLPAVQLAARRLAEDPADRLITIADRDGSPKIICAGDETWWEQDERKALAKSVPVQIASFEV